MTTTTHRRRLGVLAGALSATMLMVACGSDDAADTEAAPDLTAPPTNVTWSSLSNEADVMVPVAGEGPKNIGTYKDASEFEHSPVGAGLAAMNGPLRVAYAPEIGWQDAVKAAIAPSEARDELLTNRAAVESTGEVEEEFIPTLRGWTIDDYAEDESAATVTVYSSYSDDSLASTTYDLRWLGEDWKVDLPGDVSSVDELPGDMVEVSK
ncbi:MAG: hypothetical protein ACTHYO_14315 [Micrococcaceae bacterium]